MMPIQAFANPACIASGACSLAVAACGMCELRSKEKDVFEEYITARNIPNKRG
jgi:hypothetical protein